MSDWAYLDKDHKVVVTTDMEKSSVSRATKVGYEKAGDYSVSTVFLGLDHGWDGVPMWFETMLFGSGPLDNHCERCTTWDEAVLMHQRGIKKALRGSRLSAMDNAIKTLTQTFNDFATEFTDTETA